LTLYGLEEVTINAMKSALIRFDHHIHFTCDVIKPGYAQTRHKLCPHIPD